MNIQTALISIAVISIIWGFVTCLPLPIRWFNWRIKQSGNLFYIESKGFLKPWWHKVPDLDGCNIYFYSLDEARDFLKEKPQKIHSA